MDQVNQEKLTNNIDKILEDDMFVKVLKKSMKEMYINKKRGIGLAVVTLALIPLFKSIGYSETTISKTISLIESSNTLILALFAIIFTGYALFQALTSGETLKNLLLSNVKEMSMFQRYNLFFFGISIVYLGLIILNFILLMILRNLPTNWKSSLLTHNVNNIVASILIALYIMLNINAVIEVKCFIYNLYQCFNINTVSKAMDIMKKQGENKD